MNLAALLLDVATARPTAVALRVGADATPKVVSYAELRDDAGRVAAGLREAGVRPGDRVAFAFGNDPDFVAAYLGALGAGGVAVPLDPGSPGPELAAEVGAVEPRLVLGAIEGGRALDAVRSNGTSAVVERADGDLAALLFTAGTAGAAKPAMLTHGNLRANIGQVLSHPGLRLDPGDVALGVLPLFHVFGLNVVLGTALAAGASVVLVDAFHPAEAAEIVARAGVTVVAGVPSMYAAWLALPGGHDGHFTGVRLAVSGAAPLPADDARAFLARFGVPLHEGYGLTEASPIVTTTAVEQEVRPGSIGPPLPGIEIRLVDVEGADVFAGDPGEIWVRGPNVFPGYWRDDDATRRVLTADGWLRTGDVAVADDDGYLTLVDRSKDLVIVSGFNVYPAEVEAVLADHPDVAEAAVLGATDARTGEALTAFVVPRPGRVPGESGLRAFVAERLARYKVPATFELVAELPRNRLGKIVRRALRDDGDDTATRNPA